MLFGIGSFTQGVMRCLRDDGADVTAYLTRNYGHYGPGLEGTAYPSSKHPSPLPLLDKHQPALVIPMSIDWAQQAWTQSFLNTGIPILSPTGDGLLIERDRNFARNLCRRYKIPFPKSFRVENREEARRIIQRQPRPYVIKNPLCSPFSPVHTIVCESAEETLAWLDAIDDREGLFLQEYLGRAEIGHIALVSNGEIHSLITNQEYKRAFHGNQGIVAGAPLGGLAEKDPDDRYNLAKTLLHPLLPWLRKVGFHGPIQVTAIRHQHRWHVLEYNVRLGVTSAPLILRLLSNPTETLLQTARNQPLTPRFRSSLSFGASITLAGYGYPYVRLSSPPLPVRSTTPANADVWWNEVASGPNGSLQMTGHRIADVTAVAPTLTSALAKAYRNIRKIHCLGSYFREDIGQSLWPPGNT
jgi:phosphoribosylamine-glycine ligase